MGDLIKEFASRLFALWFTRLNARKTGLPAARAEGNEAYYSGSSEEMNPYHGEDPYSKHLRDAWLDGYYGR